MSQYPPGPPGPPPQNPGGPPPGPPSQPGWGAPQPPSGGQPGYPPQQPQPGYGQPGAPGGYGQQPYPPAMPPSSGGGNGAKILIGVAVVAVLAVGAFFAFGGSGSSDSGPEQAVRDFVAAATSNDCGKVVDLMTESNFEGVSREEATSQCQAALDSGEENMFEIDGDDKINSVEEKSNDGNVAVVTVNSTTDGEESVEDITLRKEDGKWRIDFVATAEDVEGGSSDTLPTDDGDLPGSDDPDLTIPEDFDPGDFDTSDMTTPDGELIPVCNPSSDEYDIIACSEAIGG